VESRHLLSWGRRLAIHGLCQYRSESYMGHPAPCGNAHIPVIRNNVGAVATVPASRDSVRPPSIKVAFEDRVMRERREEEG